MMIILIHLVLTLVMVASSQTHNIGNTSNIPVQYTYYVDSVNGNDDNDCKSPVSSLKTIAKVLTLPCTDNQTSYGLAANSHWREEFDVPCSGVVVGYYGSGNRPILDASDPIAASAWTLVNGKTYTYQATVTIYPDPAISWVSAWENNNRMVRANSVDDCEANAGTYYPSTDYGQGETVVALCVHLSDGTNPAGKGDGWIEYTKRKYGFLSSYPVTVNGIHTKRNLHDSGSLVLRSSGRIINCRASEGTKHNVLAGPGVNIDGLTVDEAYYGSAQSAPLIFYGNYSGESSVINDLVVKQTVPLEVPSPAVYQHGNGTAGTFTFNRPRISGLYSGIGIESGLLVVNDAVITTNSDADGSYVSTTITNSTLTTTGGTAIKQIGPLTIRNSTLSAPSGSCVLTDNSSLLDIQYSTFDNCGTAVQAYGSALNLVSRNNTFVSCGYGYSLWGPTLENLHVDSDYNAFNRSDLPFDWDGVTYHSVAEYKTGTGQDAHSTP